MKHNYRQTNFSVGIIILVLLLSTFANASGFSTEHWKFYHWLIVLSVLVFIALIPIGIIGSLIARDKTYKFSFFLFKSIVFIVLISYISMGIDNYITKQNYKPKHNFQKPYEYGIYIEQEVVFDLKEDKVIDLYLEDSSYSRDRKNLSYLTSNGMLHCDYSSRYMNIQNTSASMGHCTGVGLLLISNEGKILNYSYSYNRGVYAIKRDIKDYKLARSATEDKFSYSHDYIELYSDHLELNDTKHIETLGSYDVVFLMNKEKKQLVGYKNGEYFSPFNIKQEPKLVVYDDQKDILYVVYKNGSKVYLFTNTLSKKYTIAQHKIKSILNQAFLPWWKNPKVPFDGVTLDDINRIEEYFKNGERKKFDYHIKKNNIKNNIYEVEVTFKNKKLIFTLEVNETRSKLHSIK